MRLSILPALLLIASFGTAFAADADTAKPKPYPLDTCPISGEKLGGMGEGVTKVYKGQEVKFCCGGCPATFEKDVDGNLAKIAKQAKDNAAK